MLRASPQARHQMIELGGDIVELADLRLLAEAGLGARARAQAMSDSSHPNPASSNREKHQQHHDGKAEVDDGCALHLAALPEWRRQSFPGQTAGGIGEYDRPA